MKRPRTLAIIDPVGIKAGLDQYDVGLAKALQDIGYHVALFSNFTATDQEVESDAVFRTEPYRAWQLGSLILTYRRVLARCRAAGIESLGLHFFHFNRLDGWLVKTARRMGFRVIGIVHDVESFIHPVNQVRMRRIVAQGLDQVVVHNTYSRQELVRLVGESVASKVHIIPHGHFPISPPSKDRAAAARLRLDLPQKPFILLAFGMIKPNKGHDTLLEAIPELPEDTLVLIAGRVRPGVPKAILETMRSWEARHRVVLRLQHIPAEDVSHYFHAADAIVLPYRRVYQSGVLLRAWSEGVPVICSDLPAFLESVTDDENALVFPAGDAMQLAAAVGRLRADDALAERLRTGGYKRLAEAHSWKDIAREFSNLLA